MEIETTEQLAWYVDTLKTLFATAHREHNEAVQTFLRRFMDGLVPRDGMLPLIQDDSTRKLPVTPSLQRLQQVATALNSQVEPLPHDGSGGSLVENPKAPEPVPPGNGRAALW